MVKRIADRRNDDGFTLIELLVVIVILGILAAVVVFAVGGVNNRGEAAAFVADATTLRTAEESHCAARGTYASEPDLVAGGFLNAESELNDIAFTPPGSSGCGSFIVGCPPGTGCGAPGAPPATPNGTLVVGETFGFQSVTNPGVSTSGAVHAYWEILYNGLLALDASGNPQPELATQVPSVANGLITDSGRTYTFNLRPNVKWHDFATSVQTFDAEDVKFSFEKALLLHHPRTKNMLLALCPLVADPAICGGKPGIGTPGGLNGLQVAFNFRNPYAPLLQQLNVTEASIMPAHRYAAIPNPNLAQLGANNIGTGPFKCDPTNTPPCKSGTDGRVVRNADYWRAPLPYINEIILKPITDESTRRNALLNREVQWVWDVPNQFVADLSVNPNFGLAPTQSLGGGPISVDQLVFNLTQRGTGSGIAGNANDKPNEAARYGQIDGINPTLAAPPHAILGDLRVRQAIFQATNRNEYLDNGRFGVGTVATAPLSSELAFHADDIVLPTFSQTAAEQLLDDAGWDGPRTTVDGIPNIRTAATGHPTVAPGLPLTIELLIGNTNFDSRIAVIDSNLAQVGVNLKRVLDTDATNLIFRHRNFDTTIINYAQGYDPHVGVRRQYHSDQVSTTSFSNAAGYKNATVDTAFDQAVQTLDFNTRFTQYRTFQGQVAQDLPYMWILETPNVRGFTSKCTGFKEYTGLFAEDAYCQPAAP